MMLKIRNLWVLSILLLAGCQSGGRQASPSPEVQATDSPVSVETTPAESGVQIPPTPTTAPLATVTAPSSTPKLISGVHIHALSNPAQIELVKGAGAHWTRFDDFNWADIEPVRSDPPTYQWDTVDEAGLEMAASSGFEVIGMVLFTPGWAQKYPGVACGPIAENAAEDFARFLQALVERYSQPPYNVKYWEIGNEPDIDRMTVGGDSGYGCWGEPDDDYFGGGYYGKMLKTAYPAIRAADPEAYVLVGGLLLNCDPVNPPEKSDGSGQLQDCTSSRFLEGILKEGAGSFFDGVSFHAYDYFLGDGAYGNSNWNSSSQVNGPVLTVKTRYLQSLLAANGVTGKGLFNTEVAILCGRDGREPGCAAEDFLNTKANYAAQANSAALAAGIDANIWYSLTGWRASGLVTSSLAQLDPPALEAFGVSAGLVDGAKFQKEITQYPGIKGYEFLQGNQRVWILWSLDGADHTVELETIPARAMDVLGTALSVEETLTVGKMTVYLEWD